MKRFLILAAACALLAFTGCSQSPTSPGSGSGWTESTAHAPFHARYGASGTVFNGSMWVIGGAYSNDNGATTVFCKDVWSGSGSSWTSVNGNVTFGGRYGSQVLSMGASMYLIGGNKEGTLQNDVWSSPDGQTWTNILPSGIASNTQFSRREDFAVVVYNGLMWVIGGYVGNGGTNDVWSSPDGITWTEATANAFGVESGHWGISATVFNNQMWIVGGAYGPKPVPTYAYRDAWSSANGSAWNQSTPNGGFGNLYYYGLAANANSGELNLISGFYREDTYYPATSILYTSADGISWPQQSLSMPWRYYPVCLSFNNEVWIISGVGYTQTNTESVPVYYNDVWHSS